jgi:hypothetical protein
VVVYVPKRSWCLPVHGVTGKLRIITSGFGRPKY